MAAVIFAIRRSLDQWELEYEACGRSRPYLEGLLQAMFMATLMSILRHMHSVRRVETTTKTAMGPYLAIGLILTLIFRLYEIKIAVNREGFDES